MRSLLPFILVVVGCGKQETAAAPAEMTSTPVKYSCASGQEVTAVYSGDSASVTLPDGRTLRLPHVISGSGARFSNDTITWWTKGDSGFVMASDSVTVKDCGTTR